MKECNKCKITIHTNQEYCPLCHQILDGDPEEHYIEIYPQQDPTLKGKTKRMQRIIAFISLISIVVLFMINLLDTSSGYWSLIPIGSIVYFFLLVKFAFFTKGHTIIKINGSSIIVMLLLVFINVSSNPDYLWSVDYIVPSMIMVTNIVVFMFTLIRKHGIRYYGLTLFLMILLSAVPLLLFSIGINNYYPLAILSLGEGVLLLFYMLIFYPKAVKELLKKIFHI